ncbi:MAG: DUF1801 domain-containing protein [Parvularculaceae bacterium]
MAASAKRTTKKKAAAKKAGKSKKAELKTKQTAVSVTEFVNSVANDQRRKDAKTALALFKKITGEKPKMWGPSIIGYGSYHYKYESGREGDMCRTGFSPRSTAIVFYVMGGIADKDPLYAKLGKHRLGKSCLYINKLDDVDLGVLEKIIRKSLAYMDRKYPKE